MLDSVPFSYCDVLWLTPISVTSAYTIDPAPHDAHLVSLPRAPCLLSTYTYTSFVGAMQLRSTPAVASHVASRLFSRRMRLYNSQGSRRLVATDTDRDPCLRPIAFALPLAAFAFAVGTAAPLCSASTLPPLRGFLLGTRLVAAFYGYLCVFPPVFAALYSACY